MSERGVLLAVAAEGREFDGLLRNAQSVQRLTWPVDFAREISVGERRVILVANGPGPVLAAQAARAACERQKFEAFLSLGFCGALNPELGPNDIFVAGEVIGCGGAQIPSHSPAGHKLGRLLSTDRVAVSVSDKATLRRSGADAVEMEAAAVLRAAQEHARPFYCLRVVTDTASEALPLDFNRMRASDGRFSRARILAAACRKPGVLFPELVKLNQRCKSASKALGDFIANCRF